MPQTYRAILEKDRVRWRGDSPRTDQPVDVYITVVGSIESSRANGAAMADPLNRLASSGGLADISDPDAWQREVRKDRAMPGRAD